MDRGRRVTFAVAIVGALVLVAQAAVPRGAAAGAPVVGTTVVPLARPTPTPSPTPVPTPTPPPTPTPTPTPDPTPTPTPDPTPTPTPDPTPTPSPPPSASPSPGTSPTPRPSATPRPGTTAAPGGGTSASPSADAVATPVPTPRPTGAFDFSISLPDDLPIPSIPAELLAPGKALAGEDADVGGGLVALVQGLVALGLVTVLAAAGAILAARRSRSGRLPGDPGAARAAATSAEGGPA